MKFILILNLKSFLRKKILEIELYKNILTIKIVYVKLFNNFQILLFDLIALSFFIEISNILNFFVVFITLL